MGGARVPRAFHEHLHEQEEDISPAGRPCGTEDASSDYDNFHSEDMDRFRERSWKESSESPSETGTESSFTSTTSTDSSTPTVTVDVSDCSSDYTLLSGSVVARDPEAERRRRRRPATTPKRNYRIMSSEESEKLLDLQSSEKFGVVRRPSKSKWRRRDKDSVSVSSEPRSSFRSNFQLLRTISLGVGVEVEKEKEKEKEWRKEERVKEREKRHSAPLEAALSVRRVPEGRLSRPRMAISSVARQPQESASVGDKEIEQRLSFVSSSTGYSSARSSLRSSDLGDEQQSLHGDVDRRLLSAATSQSESRRAELLARGPSQLDLISMELLDTERAYVNDLNDVIQGYLCYFVDHREDLQMTVDDVSRTFGCIERLFQFNRQLYQQLDLAQLDAVKMCKCFVDNAGNFNSYITYCTDYQRMISMLNSLKKKNAAVEEALGHRQTILGHALDLNSYLLKPVQRILKYHLFIENMLKQSAHLSESDRVVIRKALESMTAQAQRINDEKKRSEHGERVRELQAQLTRWKNHENTDLSAYGDLLLEATFKLAGAKTSRQLFLFEEMLLIAKERGGVFLCKDYIMCSNLMLNESVGEEQLAFQVVAFDNPKGQQYLLLALSMEQKRVWMRELKRMVLDHFEKDIPEKTKQLMLATDNTQPKTAFGRPEFAEVSLKNVKKIPKYLERRRKSVDSGKLIRRRSLSTSREKDMRLKTDVPVESVSLASQCTCSDTPFLSSRTPSRLDAFKDAFKEDSMTERRLFESRRRLPLPPPCNLRSSEDVPLRLHHSSAESGPSLLRCTCNAPACSSSALTAPVERAPSRLLASHEIEKTFDELYRDLQLVARESVTPPPPALVRLDALVRGHERRSRTPESRGSRCRSKSLNRLDEYPSSDVEEEKVVQEVVLPPRSQGYQKRVSEQVWRVRQRRQEAQQGIPLTSEDFPVGLQDTVRLRRECRELARPSSMEPRFSLLTQGRQRTPLTMEQCAQLDDVLLHEPALGVVREMVKQLERPPRAGGLPPRRL